MGNRGIQLSVFFVISLMLIAGLFSNTAMAADGDGRIAATMRILTRDSLRQMLMVNFLQHFY